MRSSSQPAIERRRVKTGCLPCRKRRRKCDENRPKCINCTKRGATCQYPNFKSSLLHRLPSCEVDEGLSRSQSPSSATVQRSGHSSESHIRQPLRSSSDAFAYNTIALSDNELERRDTSPELPSTSGNNHHSSTENRPGQFEQINEPGTHTIFHHIPSTVWNTTAVVIANPASVANETSERSYNIPWPHSTSAITGDTGPGSSSEEPGSSPSLRSLTDGRIHRITRQEDIQLLSHFRYHLAPWLDVNDSKAFFGIELLSAARDSPIIMATVLKLAAIHKSITSSSYGMDHARTHYQEHIPEFQILLPRETLSVQRKCRLLLKVGELFGLPPRRWRELASESDEYLRTTLIDVMEEPLFSWCFRIDLAAAIVAQQPLLTDPHVWDTWRLSKQSTLDDATRHESFFFILGECLLLKSEEQHIFSSSPASSLMPQQVFGTRWLSLWNESQLWYQNRPPEMCQVLSCRSVEAGIIDPSSTALFPIEVFSSPLALVQNVAYHIASILLLASKPRLVELQATSRQASSKAWHMHSIAGICERNDFAEQWDPVLIAGLLLIAPNMTHDSQQEVLLQCLRRASHATGLDLADEIMNLQTCWQP